MASPLKFLRRLVSRGSERKQAAEKAEATNPDVLATAGPAETASEKVLEDADRAAGVELLPQDQSEAGFAETAAVDETGAKTEDTAEGAPASIPAGGGSPSDSRPGVDVTAVHDAMEVEPAAEGPARKHRALSKNTRPAVGGAQVSKGPSTPSDETMSLDEEIKVLRGQLASRLKIQNAQLKKMLERFER